MGLVTTNPVVGVSVKEGLKPVSSTTETSWNIYISLVASLCMILSNQQITKVLANAQAGLRLSCLQNLEDKFSRIETHSITNTLIAILVKDS